MRSALRLAILYLAISAGPSAAPAQQTPPPVDLGIQNIPQETIVWCWAAVAQQIVLAAQGHSRTPPQCAMVGMANGAHPQFCCNYPSQCMVTGSLQQIQWLIAQFGGHASKLTLPADPLSLYHELAAGHPVIMAVQSSPYSGHVVVIRGMEWIQTATGVEPILLVNDPMGYFTQPVPFRQIAYYWRAAIVVE
jgi:Papain-like cysteine protease AvrRpt2